MDKNEILKRSQTENILGDEREKQIRLESESDFHTGCHTDSDNCQLCKRSVS